MDNKLEVKEEGKKTIGIIQVKQLLKGGFTRDDIAAHYGITKAECKMLFQNSELKGLKTTKKPSFVIVEDEAVKDIPKDEVEKTKTTSEEEVVKELEEEQTTEEKEKSQEVAEEPKRSWTE